MLNAFRRIANQTPEPFVAPIPSVGSVDIMVVQDGTPFRFHVNDTRRGWFNVQPIDRRSAQIVDEANFVEIQYYLDGLKKFTVIAVCPVGEQTWLCLPYNYSDARQKNWEGEPRLIHLVDQNIQPLDRVVVGVYGGIFLFVDIAYGLAVDRWAQELQYQIEQSNDSFDITHAPRHYQQPFRILADRIRFERERILAEEKEASRKNALAEANAKTLTLEEKIRNQLGFMGADLVDWSNVNRDAIKVTFRYRGANWTIPLVNPKTLRVTSIGFCVSHFDQYHNLSSAVAAFDKARDLHRFDIPKELWRNAGGINLPDDRLNAADGYDYEDHNDYEDDDD